jgi:hypothetical protein
VRAVRARAPRLQPQSSAPAHISLESFILSPPPPTPNTQTHHCQVDVANNGPDALKKYSGDKAIVEAWMEAAELLEQQQQSGPADGGSSSGSGSSSVPPTPPGSPVAGGGGIPGVDPAALAAARAALGVAPEEVVARMMARPELVGRVADPEVRAALADIASSPWKIVKYLLNKKVMGALREMKEVIGETRR